MALIFKIKKSSRSSRARFLYSEKLCYVAPLLVNPLTSRNDQDRISLYYISTISSRQDENKQKYQLGDC